MAISFSLILLLVAVITTTTITLRPISAAGTHSPPHRHSPHTTSPPLSAAEAHRPPAHRHSPHTTSPSPPPPPFTSHTPPPPLAEIQENHFHNIIDALIGAGDFAGWANLLSAADPSISLPLTATFFIPGNDAVSNLSAAAADEASFDAYLIPYHIVPQRLTFSDLQQFTTRTRLPTLLPAKYIVITNNSPPNFTVDDSQITQPDIFVNSAFAVHGVKKLLDYSVYGGGTVPSPPPAENATAPKATPPPPSERNPVSPGEVNVGLRSGASCFCSWIFVGFFSILCAVLVILESV